MELRVACDNIDSEAYMSWGSEYGVTSLQWWGGMLQVLDQHRFHQCLSTSVPRVLENFQMCTSSREHIPYKRS